MLHRKRLGAWWGGVVLAAGLAVTGAPNELRAQQTLGDFEQRGLRLGAFDLFSQLRFTGAYNDNVFAVPDGGLAGVGKQSDYFLIVQPQMLLETNARRHRFYLLANGSLGRYDDFDERNFNDFTVETGGRWDASRTFSVNAFAAYDNLHTSVDDDDRRRSLQARDYDRFRGGIGLSRDWTRSFARVNSGVSRVEYQDLVDGTDNTRWNNRVRIGYRLDRQYDVFVEGRHNLTRYDNPPGARNRDQTNWALLTGTSVDFDRVVAGEFAVGMQYTTFEDGVTSDQLGFSFTGGLDFVLTPRTSLGFNASQAVEPSDAVGASGRNTTRLGLSLGPTLSRHVRLGANASYNRLDFLGISRLDETYGAGVSASYNVNRYVSVSASYSHTQRMSDETFREYTQNQVFLTLQGRY